MMKVFLKNTFYLLALCCLCQVLLSCTSSVEPLTKEIELIDPVYPKKASRQHELIIHKDEDGHPSGYSMDLINSVCLDKKCKLVEVTMYWDDAGNYSHLTYPEKRPLTKVEHEPFTEEDYLRLDKILKDKQSILQKHSLAYLAKEPDKPKKKKVEKSFASLVNPAEDEDVDGESKATPAAVKAAVVKDAAWTTWVLWTYANTETVPILQSETESQCTPAYIQKTLNSKNWQRIEFILKYLSREGIYSNDYTAAVSKALFKANIDQIEFALSYLKNASKSKNDYFRYLIEALPEQGNYNAAMIIEELMKGEQLEDEILLALTASLKNLNYYAIHLTLRAIEQKELFSDKIEMNISELLYVKDFFVARRAYNFLKDQKLSTKTTEKLAGFAQKHEDRL